MSIKIFCDFGVLNPTIKLDLEQELSDIFKVKISKDEFGILHYLKKNNLVMKLDWLRGTDLNRRPSGYEPDELPDCSTPRYT